MSSPAPALEAPPPHRFARGFLLPWVLFSSLRRDGDAWRRYRRVLSRHLFWLAALGAFFSLFVSDIVLSFQSFAELASWKRIVALVSSLYGVLAVADGLAYVASDRGLSVVRVDDGSAVGAKAPHRPYCRLDGLGPVQLALQAVQQDLDDLVFIPVREGQAGLGRSRHEGSRRHLQRPLVEGVRGTAHRARKREDER